MKSQERSDTAGAGSRRPFVVDPDRLYDVGADGVPRTTDAAEPLEWLGARHRRMLAAFAGAVVLVSLLAAGTVVCFVLGARLWAAIAALATLAASPLLLLGEVLDWWRHRRGRRRRHRQRPRDFPGVGTGRG